MKDRRQKFYIDTSYVEHGCCWDAAICKKVKDGEGSYLGDVGVVLECDKEDAQFICDALNKAYGTWYGEI